MVDMAYILPWIEKANGDMLVAHHIAETMRPVSTEIVCFHCQQAVEKYLKAFLVYNDQEPPKTHELTELIRQCCTFDADFINLNQKCKFLMPFAVRTRYPGGIDPEENDMKVALSYADDVIKYVKAKIGS